MYNIFVSIWSSVAHTACAARDEFVEFFDSPQQIINKDMARIKKSGKIEIHPSFGQDSEANEEVLRPVYLAVEPGQASWLIEVNEQEKLIVGDNELITV